MKLFFAHLILATSAALASSVALVVYAAQNSSAGVTAEQQSNAKSDVQITRQIRQAITKDKSLSVSAHNVKIVTKQGHVTLKGSVNSQDEKSKVETAATTVAGSGNVDDQLTIQGQS